MTSGIGGSGPRLIDQLNMMPKEDGKVVVSQHAQIGDKKVKITMEFDGHITYDEAKRAMEDSFEKVAHLTEAHKLGEVYQGQKTHSLTIPSDRPATRTFTYEKPHFFRKGGCKPSQMKKVHALLPENLVKSKNENGNTGIKSSTSIPSPKQISVHIAAEEPGKVLTDRFEVNGKLVATEEAERAGTVAMFANSLSAKMEYLNDRLNELQQPPQTAPKEAEIAAIQKELEKIKTDLGNYIKPLEKATHGSTNAPRLAFKTLDDAKTQMAPILMNLRMQTVKNAAGEVISAVSRSGAISDFRNGEVSLQELKDLHDLENRHHLPLERENQLVRFYTSSNGMPTADATLLIKTKALVAYGPDALASQPLTSEQQAILNKMKSAKTLEEGFAKLNPIEKMNLEKIAIDKSKLDHVIAARSDFLKQLVLQDLLLHFQTTKASKDPILYNRTAIVDLQKEAKTEYGCVLHERTQGLDMKALFDELQDAKVVFDCKNSQAAFIDHEGVIHMPTDCSAGVSSAKLIPAFFNICVQGDKCQNTGMQQQINEQTLNRLENHYGNDERFQELKTSLRELSRDASMDPNRTVLISNQFVQENNGYSGINCFGGKDRTGYDLALITHDKIAKELKVNPSDPQMAEVKTQLLRPDGIASQTANDNTGEIPLKLTRFDLELYDTKTSEGKLHRIADGVNAAFVGVKPILKQKLGLSFLSISPTPGQVYNESAPIKSTQKMKRIFQHFSRGNPTTKKENRIEIQE